MREIKFRAWDIENKVFIPTDAYAVVTTDFNAFGVMLKDWENYKEWEYFYDYSQILSQYTGLKDKNGVEIFEGDVIDYGSGRFCPITYEKNKFGIKFKNGAHEGCWLDLTKFEVIGNIYETPELLNQ